MPLPDDQVRLLHMRDAAREAMEYSEGKTRQELDTNRILALALRKLLEIIGEASVEVSEKTQERFPKIPWAVIKGMRNRLIHGYYKVELDIVWNTIIEDLPPLMTALEEAIPQFQEGKET